MHGGYPRELLAWVWVGETTLKRILTLTPTPSFFALLITPTVNCPTYTRYSHPDPNTHAKHDPNPDLNLDLNLTRTLTLILTLTLTLI